ncbi:kelch domain-containing protein 10-like isoform X2 [Ptychodera flava]|uniref:kelch domain-containing protein 10-like isoform X2 n=1 Tax=Ptychodera flava TaxID=63121 RepID=UPI00396A2EF3
MQCDSVTVSVSMLHAVADRTRSPYPRSGHCCACDNSNFYVFGGYNPTYEVIYHGEPLVLQNELFKELWYYNFSTGVWSLELDSTGNIPLETASMSMVMSGNNLLLFGGTSFPWGARSNNDVYVYNVKQKCWSKLQCTGNVPPAKYGQAMALHKDNLYVFGGCRKITDDHFHFDAELYKLNLDTCIWEMLSDEEQGGDMHPRGMYRHGIACDEQRMYVLGYSWIEVYTVPTLQKICAYNFSEKRWERLDTQPDPTEGFPRTRIYHSCAQRNQEVYISGGHNNSVIFNDLWKLHLPSLQWTKIHTVMPVPSFFHSAAITPSGCMYYFGGVVNLDDSQRTGEICRIWLAVPSLFELCWHHVAALIPDLASLSDERLITMGIPRSLIARVRAA